MILSITFAISELLAILELIILKHDDRKQSFISRATFAILTIELLHALFLGILNVVGVTYRLSLFTVFNFSFFIILEFIKRKYGKTGIQSFEINIFELIFIGLFVYSMYYFVVHYFTVDLITRDPLGDASTHYYWAKKLAQTGRILNGKYLGIMTGGIAMSFFSPWVNEFYYFKCFNLMQCYHLAMSILVFYSAGRLICKNNFSHIFLVITTFLYAFGYPLYAIEFGFVYFGVSVTVINYMIFIFLLHENRLIDKKLMIICANLALYGVFVSYTLLVPAMYSGVFLYGIYLIRDKKGGVLDWILLELKMFIIPCLLGMLQTASDAKEIGGGLGIDGGCYSDLYSNFILIMPVALCGLLLTIKYKRNIVVTALGFSQLIGMALFFFGAMKHKVSAYYYMKNNNVLWLLCFILGLVVIEIASEKHRYVIYSYALSIAFLLTMLFVGDDKIKEHNNRMIAVDSTNIINIYYFTWNYFSYPQFNKNVIELYNYAYNNMSNPSKGIVVGTEIFNRWFSAIMDSEKSYAYGDLEEYKKQISEDTEYVCIINSDAYYKNQEYFDSLDQVVYTNGAGTVVKLK